MDKQLEDWAAKWEQAQKKNIFPKREDFSPSAKSAETTFFGTLSKAPSGAIKDVDAKYWKDVYRQSTGSQVLTEDKKILRTNPVHQSSIGPDTDLSSAAMGLTFTEDDIEELSKLKLKLHDLENQLNEFEGRGENAKKFESQISSVKKKIADLSDSFGKEFAYGGGKSASHE